MQEMLFREHGINWNDYPDRFKRGTVVHQETVHEPVVYTDKRTNTKHVTPDVERRIWVTGAAPRFTQDRQWFAERIGRMP
jgi:tRNA(His) 5'-end guanylyltransferase